ncbi:hypothetical protein GF322_01595 [Candidatus Dependentiae bacterium]|nr:hypothetical protein [Candidatus Dependentiae bacterium]
MINQNLYLIINFCKKKIIKHKTFIFSISIFSLIFILLGLPFKNWWFYGSDDFHGLYLGYKTTNWNDLFYFFKNGHTNQEMGPSNYKFSNEPQNFFSAYYRPLYCIYLTFQYWLLGTNGYYYHLCNVFFHTTNSLSLFYLFLHLTNLFTAFLFALMFAVHPQIAYRFGAIVNLHYYINAMLLLLLFIFFKNYIDSKKWYYNLLSVILFSLSLFTRETSIVIPAILFLGLYLYPQKYKFSNFKNLLNKTLNNFYKVFGLLCSAICFLLLRIYLYPIKFTNCSKPLNLISIISKIKNRFPELKVFIYDVLSLSWLPWGQKNLRCIILISIILFLFYSFIKNTKKVYVTYFITSALIMLWPAYLVNYNPRYFYEAYPFILFAFIFLFKYSKINFKKFKIIGTATLTFFVIFLFIFTFVNFKIRENKMKIMSGAVYELIQNPIIQNRNLCFISHPLESWGEQNAQIFWTLLNNTSPKILFDSATAITQIDCNVIKPTKYINICADLFEHNYCKITPIKNGFNFKSLNPKKIHFEPKIERSDYSLGKKIINKTINFKGLEVVTDFSLIFDKHYLDLDPLFIKWDYEKRKFIIL